MPIDVTFATATALSIGIVIVMELSWQIPWIDITTWCYHLCDYWFKVRIQIVAIYCSWASQDQAGR